VPKGWGIILTVLELAQKGMGISGAKMLTTNIVTEENMLGQRRKLITVGSRTRNQISGI
jgi:aromatic ring hydroxylase